MRAGRATAAAVGATLFGALPVFVVGALGVQIRAELQFGEAAFGLLVSAFFAVSALLSAWAGRFVDGHGVRTAMLLSAGTTAVTLAAAGSLARSWWSLLLLMGAAGAGNAFAQPAANFAIVRQVPAARRGLAFGIKQSAVPASTMLGGIGLVLVASRWGWRGVLVAASALALAFGAWLLRSGLDLRPDAHEPGTRGALRPLGPLLLLTGAACFGAGAANALAAFFVQGTVAAGLGEAAAGIWLTLGSASGMVARVLVGWYVDQGSGPRYGLVAGMIVLGAGGFALLAGGFAAPVVVATATLLGFAAGWGWAGLFNYNVVLSYPRGPAGATGTTQTGIYLGGTLGPLLFGVTAEQTGFPVAWLLGGAALLAAAAMTLLAARLLATPVATGGVDGPSRP